MTVLLFNTSVTAAEKTAKLKDSIEKEHMYRVLTPDYMGSFMSANKSQFKNLYDESYVAVTGNIRYYSVKDDAERLVVYGNSKGVEVESSRSDIKSIVRNLKPGDKVTVFGQVDVTGITGSSFEIVADHILVNPEKEPDILSYIFYPDLVLDEETVTDLAKDGHVSFNLPESWKNEYVLDRLTNNDVNGYSFFLNAIYPQNTEYPENFYMFYFKYETYLDRVDKNLTSGDIKDIEELVIKNILKNLNTETNIEISNIDLPDGQTVGYCPTVYKPADGNHYRLEFFFKPDSTGITCMLYLYYPDDGSTAHTREVSYVIQTLESSK